MRRLMIAAAITTLACGAWLLSKPPPARSGEPAPAAGSRIDPAQLTEWVTIALKQMQTIQPGATREELLKVFITEGGLSTATWRTYVHRDCPYTKVDVEFKLADWPERDKDGRLSLEERPNDVVTKISRPYLQWSIMD